MLSRRFLLHQAAVPVWRTSGPTWTRRSPGWRYASSLEAGENNTGHIVSGPNEGVLFFNNLFPSSIQWLFRIPFLTSIKSYPKLLSSESALIVAEPAELLERAQARLASASGGDAAAAAEVIEVLPRMKEGGAYVKFSYGPGATSQSVNDAVQKYLEEKAIRPWWAPMRRVNAGLVKGQPWVEDLYRMPSGRIKVEFLPTAPGAEVADLSQEQLYAHFRPYGKLADVIVQPSDSKILPKFAYLEFAQVRKAIMAKNCMHGFTIGEAQGGGKLGTVLRLSYEKRQKARWIMDWLTSHPRIVIPAVAALVAGITVAIFDPIRTLFIKAHITRSLHLEDYKAYRWIKGQAQGLLERVRLRGSSDDDAGMQAIWENQKDNIEQIQTWLLESADTFVIVQGPRGSGKKEMVVGQALKHHRNKLVIDCKPIQEARGDAHTISAAAVAVGYKPVFSWMNSVSGLIDLAAQGTTGVKTGFSETVENQLGKIWNNTATALKQIALEGRKKNDKDAALSDDEYLEAHPERRPVVVIDNFLHKSQEKGIVYDKLAEWAARLTTSNIAHVIFLTTDVSFTKSLSKALPDRVFRQISLSDCTPETARRYVINRLDIDAIDALDDDNVKKPTPSERRTDLDGLDAVLPALGGRLTDLEFLARRITAGETPLKAVEEIVDQSAGEILKMFISAGGSSDDAERKWTPSQAWLLIKQLALAESLRYNEVLLADAYKTGGERALQALEQAELISIQTAAGRPYSIQPGRPVYQPAFRRLTEDKVLQSKLDLAMLAESIKVETASIEKYEQELHLLGELPKQPPELMSRLQWLLSKLQASQAKVEGYERESGMLKKILMSEY